MKPASYHADSKQLIDWHGGDFGAANALFTQSSSMTKPEAEGLVEELVSLSQKNTTPPKLPYETRQTKMVGLAMRRGREVFWESGLAFLRDEPWLPNVPGYDIDKDSWRPLADHFYIYEEKWHAHVAAEKKQRERDAARQAQQRAEIRDSRWARYLLAGRSTPWPGMTDAERAFVARAESEKDAPVRDISEEEFARANAAKGREFAAKKKQIEGFISLCDQMVLLTGQYDTGHVRDCLLAARSVNDLKMVHGLVVELHSMLRVELDPTHPSADDFFADF